MKEIYVIIALFLVLSCRQDEPKQTQELILGEWKAAKENNYSNCQGYLFMEDGLCENLGFFDYFVSESYLLHAPYVYCMDSRSPSYLSGETALNNIRRYYGNRTYYKIEEDTLRIYDPAKNVWFDQHISFQSPDTMILSYTNECQDFTRIPFVRKTYQTDDKPLFDRLIFSTPDGIWNEKLFSIERDGTFISYGYKGKKELFIGKMQEGEFERIENLFKKVDFNLLEGGLNGHSYFAPQIVFVKDKEMTPVSSMLVPMSNIEYYQAYLSALFSPYYIRLEPVEEDAIQQNFFKLYDLSIYYSVDGTYMLNNHSAFGIDVFEAFYLNILLSNAKESEVCFNPDYTFTSRNQHIETDGRYYRLADKDGNEKILDIGFNFIDDIHRKYINSPRENTIEISYK